MAPFGVGGDTPGGAQQVLVNESMDSFAAAAEEFDKSVASHQVSNPHLMLGIDGHPSYDPSASLNMDQSIMERDEVEDEEDSKIPDESRISKALSEQI